MVDITFEAIIPKPIRTGVVRVYILNEIRLINTEIKKDFDRTARTFNKKPKFEKDVGLSADVATISVETTDENYIRLSEGVPAGDRVLSAGKLAFRFPGVYSAKTIPGVLNAREGGASGNIMFVRKHDRTIPWPGIEARHFDETVHKEWEPKIAPRMQEAFDKAALKTGHILD